MSKNTYISWKQMLETTGRKLLCVILAFARTEVLLVNAIEVVAKLVHENMQEHECASLHFREPTRDTIFAAVV